MDQGLKLGLINPIIMANLSKAKNKVMAILFGMIKQCILNIMIENLAIILGFGTC